MIEAYFEHIEHILQEFPTISSSFITKKFYNAKQGYLTGSITFENGYRLEFIEVKDIDVNAKIKYRYQYMNECNDIVFRYDNAPHHRNISTFPHHKHIQGEIIASSEPTLFDVLLEIAQQDRFVTVNGEGFS